jgi:hypothetical protein
MVAGLHGIYQGLTATILKQGSNQAIRFFVMETLKDWYRGEDKAKKVPTLITGLMGATAGAASVFGNTPIDVVKTRMQVSVAFFTFLCVCVLDGGGWGDAFDNRLIDVVKTRMQVSMAI